MKKIMIVGLLLTVLVSLGGCCWPGHRHGGYGHGWDQRHDRYEYQDRYRGGYYRHR